MVQKQLVKGNATFPSTELGAKQLWNCPSQNGNVDIERKKNESIVFLFQAQAWAKFFSFQCIWKWTSGFPLILLRSPHPPRPISRYSSDTPNICFQTVRYLVKWFIQVDPSCPYSVQDLLAILIKDKQYFQMAKCKMNAMYCRKEIACFLGEENPRLHQITHQYTHNIYT